MNRDRLLFRVQAATLILLSLLLGSRSLPAQQQEPIKPDIVVDTRLTERVTINIAVPPFERIGRSGFEQPFFSELIMNDLEMSGYFSPPSNPRFAAETQALDQTRNRIHFAEWYRTGVTHLIKGRYEIQGDRLRVLVKTWDTAGGKYMFGKEYKNYKRGEARRLAHRISDDIHEQILGTPGVASTELLFVRQLDDYGRDKQIARMDADGKNIRALTNGGELVATPCWGANGTEVYYTTWRDFNPDLEGMILTSGQRWWVSRQAGFNLSPAWSPEHQLIALTLTKPGNSEIYTMNREGKQLRRITFNRAIDSSPVWSRDHRQIAFTSNRSGTPQIWIMDVATLQARRLTYNTNYCDGAAWSPAGPERIAYCGRVDDKFQIFTCNPDGSDVRQLTNGPFNNEAPTWSPNGQILAFESDQSGRKQIYTIFAADGSNRHQLTRQDASHSPAWSPLYR